MRETKTRSSNKSPVLLHHQPCWMANAKNRQTTVDNKRPPHACRRLETPGRNSGSSLDHLRRRSPVINPTGQTGRAHPVARRFPRKTRFHDSVPLNGSPSVMSNTLREGASGWSGQRDALWPAFFFFRRPGPIYRWAWLPQGVLLGFARQFRVADLAGRGPVRLFGG